MKPAPGTLVVFPSTLKHWVHPNTAEEERVTIAINAKIAVDPAKMRQAQQQAAHESNRTLPDPEASAAPAPAAVPAPRRKAAAKKAEPAKA